MKKILKIIFALTALLLTAIIGATVALAGVRDRNKVVYEIVDRRGDVSEDYSNILFLGMDREAGLTDVMMLINVNNTTGKMTVAQIPRDTYAEYTDGSYKKLNGAYNTLGGASGVAEFLEDSMGIEIHHYVCIGLDTFGEMVDAIGGVEIDLPIDMNYSDPEQGLYISLKAGKQTLDGKSAEHFVRFRARYADGDLGRIDAQKLFMSAFFAKIYRDFSPVMAAKLTAAAKGVETDIAATDMLSVGMRAMSFGAENIRMLTLPGKEAIATQSGASYYVISAPSVSEIMRECFGGASSFDAEGKFLNERYEEFARIYNEYTEYTVNSVLDILQDGI